MGLGLHFGSKKTECIDKPSKIIEILLAFFEPKWSPIWHNMKYPHLSRGSEEEWKVQQGVVVGKAPIRSAKNETNARC